MTQDLVEHLRNLSSRQGRYWLRDSRAASTETTGNDLPFQSVEDASDRSQVHESVVVSIPNVAALNARAAGIVDNAASQTAMLQQTVTRARERASRPQVAAPALKFQSIPAAPQPETIARAVQSPPVLSPVVPTAAVPTTVAPMPEPPKVAEPIVETETKPKSDDAVEAARSSQSKNSADSIVKIADEIISKHPIAAPSLLMFAGSQASMHADETCARVAAELASRNFGRVLLIDSDFVGRRLTKASGMSSQGGLSEIMNIALPWEKAILRSGSSKLDFMAAGSCPHKRWTPKETLREAIAEIRNDYQFVCISVGDAHSSAGALWSELSDGAFLVVSAIHSSDSVAESAADRLREKGARLNGCIVADVPPEQQQ